MPVRHWVLATVCFVLSWPLGAARAREDTERSLSPYFFVDGPADGVEPFALESTHVRANVSGVIADVTVEQTYRNGGTRPIHARYVFPASTRAAVHAMTIQVGDKRVVAKIKEREAATREYEQAAASGKTASLLQQDRPNVFSMNVSNILPGDHVVVELRYSELLVPADGVYEFVYPTVVGPRYATAETAGAASARDAFVQTPYLPSGDSPDSAFAIEVALSTGVPLADIRSATHRVDVHSDAAGLAHVALAAGQGFAGNRDFSLAYRLAGSQIQSGLLLQEGRDENHFLLMVQPPARVSPEQIPAREYVFVLDVSGSMFGFPLDTAKALIQDLIGHLRPTDSFNVLLFSGGSRLLSPQSLPATADNVRKAVRLIGNESGGGGTELEAALRTVLALPRSEHVSRSVVVLTDGYIAEERGAFELVANAIQSTNVFAFGIGSSVNRHLIEGLARAGQGEPFVVTGQDEAHAAATRFRRYIESPLLTEVSVQYEGFDAYEIEPAKQPDLFANRPIVVFGKWRGPRTGSIEVRGRTATGNFAAQLAVADSVSRPENSALPQLWARARIARLSDYAIGEDASEAREVTALGLKYSLLTKYTSFIAVLEQVRNPSGLADDVDQPQPLPQGVSELAVGEGEYASGAEPELLWLLGLLLAIAAVKLALRQRAAKRTT